MSRPTRRPPDAGLRARHPERAGAQHLSQAAPQASRALEALDEQIGALILADRGKLLQSAAGREIVSLIPVMLSDCYHTDLRIRPLLPRLWILACALPVECRDAMVEVVTEMGKLLPPGKKAKKRLLRRANPKTTPWWAR